MVTFDVLPHSVRLLAPMIWYVVVTDGDTTSGLVCNHIIANGFIQAHTTLGPVETDKVTCCPRQSVSVLLEMETNGRGLSVTVTGADKLAHPLTLTVYLPASNA